ncbi:Uncharacterised protein [Helicobacter mustelae]|nr:hypothetical protein [Helicobacter mustelae]SQH71677.1 Uncharacterised protein [Helicobacter mustelae]STP12802.1 Uncharacterised protein [Helicobacter mustelae]
MQEIVMIGIFIIAAVGFVILLMPRGSKGCGCGKTNCKTTKIQKKDP